MFIWGTSLNPASEGKESSCNSGDQGSIPGSGWSPGRGNDSPWLENSMDRGARQATVHGVSKSPSRLSNSHFHFHSMHNTFSSVQFSSATQSCPTLCDPMNCSTPGLPVHHQLPEFTQIHVHRVSDAIQPSHPLSSPSPPAPNPSQHQSLFQWVSSSHEVAKVLEFQL